MPFSNILIIDDDTDDIEFLTDALRDCGVADVNSVLNAMEAFHFLEKNKGRRSSPKLIITDLNLPGISGAEFIVRLKSKPLFKHIPVIILSTSIPDKEMDQFREMGVVGFLKKPDTYNAYLEMAKFIKDRVAA